MAYSQHHSREWLCLLKDIIPKSKLSKRGGKNMRPRKSDLERRWRLPHSRAVGRKHRWFQQSGNVGLCSAQAPLVLGTVNAPVQVKQSNILYNKSLEQKYDTSVLI